MVESITAGSIIGDSLTESGQSRNKLASDMDTFLMLLTAQLEAQDPLSPMDSTEFTNQLVLFAQVEQQIDQNENLEALLVSNVKTQQAMAVNFLDSYVEVETNKVMLQDGQAVFTYGLSATAKSVTVNVLDENGELVRSYKGDPSQGLHKIVWDGTDYNGEAMPSGVYKLEVSAVELDDSEEDLETWTTSLGKVTGVASDDAATYLAMGELSVDMEKVLGVFKELPLDANTGGDVISDGGDDAGDDATDDTADAGDDDATGDDATDDDSEDVT